VRGIVKPGARLKLVGQTTVRRNASSGDYRSSFPIIALIGVEARNERKNDVVWKLHGDAVREKHRSRWHVKEKERENRKKRLAMQYPTRE